MGYMKEIFYFTHFCAEYILDDFNCFFVKIGVNASDVIVAGNYVTQCTKAFLDAMDANTVW